MQQLVDRNGAVSYVIYVKGTNFSDWVNWDANTLLDNIPAVKGDLDEIAVDRILEEFPDIRTAPVMLVGYSQGGMDVQNLAAAKGDDGLPLLTSVQQIVTFGSAVRSEGIGGIPAITLITNGDPIPLTMVGANNSLWTIPGIDDDYADHEIHSQLCEFVGICAHFDYDDYSEILYGTDILSSPHASGIEDFQQRGCLGSW